MNDNQLRPLSSDELDWVWGGGNIYTEPGTSIECPTTDDDPLRDKVGFRP